MPIPLALTTISVRRPDPTVDGYAETKPDPTLIVTGLPASITNDSGTSVLTGGVRTEYMYVLNADPADIQAQDLVTDDATGQEYVVVWATLRQGLGLDHVSGRLRIVRGAY